VRELSEEVRVLQSSELIPIFAMVHVNQKQELELAKSFPTNYSSLYNVFLPQVREFVSLKRGGHSWARVSHNVTKVNPGTGLTLTNDPSEAGSVTIASSPHKELVGYAITSEIVTFGDSRFVEVFLV
jgi:hypothetical protein